MSAQQIPPARARSAWLAVVLLVLSSVGGASAELRTVLVRPGESLSHIAYIELGDARLWTALYLANRDRIKRPEIVYPGQRLVVPELGPEERAAALREGRSLRRP